MPFHVLNARHLMVGKDMHIPWAPGSPAPAPAPVPYLTVAPMMGVIPMATSKMTTSVGVDGMAPIMVRGTDIGPMIPHAGPPSQTLPLELMASGSKSHFGVTSYRVKDQAGASGAVAVGLFGAANLNLNCGTPAPLAAGIVVAPTTHLAGLKVGDIVSGFYTMAWDRAAQRILSAVGEVVGGIAGDLIHLAGARVAAGVLGRTVGRLVARATNAGVALNKLGLGLVAGSPLGISSSTFFADPSKQSVYDQLSGQVDVPGRGDSLGQAVDDYFSAPAITSIPPRADPEASDTGPGDTTTAGGVGPDDPDAGAADGLDEGGGR